jgi:hypothetical protein
MMRIKQHFRENKDFTNAFQNDKPAIYYSFTQFTSTPSFPLTMLRFAELQLPGEAGDDGARPEEGRQAQWSVSAEPGLSEDLR